MSASYIPHVTIQGWRQTLKVGEFRQVAQAHGMTTFTLGKPQMYITQTKPVSYSYAGSCLHLTILHNIHILDDN